MHARVRPIVADALGVKEEIVEIIPTYIGGGFGRKLVVAPALGAGELALTAGAAFVLFRLFDVAKPWPVCALERLPGGVGIMADDVLAGVFACALLQLTAGVLT